MMAGGCGVVLGISDFEDAPADATTGVGGMGGTGTGGGGAGGDGGALACEPGSKMSCYEGPAGTEGRGACVPGEKTCLSDGSGFGECVGDVQPQPMDDCTNNVDANCDTMLTCSCTPGAMLTCYDGPNGTENNPPCQRGERTCNPMGTGYGPCDGQVVPEPVDECGTPVDENCNGVVDELCTCMPDQTQPCYGGPPGTQGVGVCQAGTATCNMTGTAWGPCVGEVQPGIADCSALGNESCSPMPCGEGLWSRIFTTAQKEDYDIPKSIDIDDNGNVFTAGTLVDTGQPLDIGGLLVNAAFVAKLNNTGATQWVKQWPANVHTIRVTSDSGNSYAAGGFSESIDIDGQVLTSAGSSDVFVASWDAAGTKRWAFRAGGASAEKVDTITHQNGSLIVGGTFTGTLSLNGGPAMTAIDGIDGFVGKLSPNSGAHLWSRPFGDVAGQPGSTQTVTSVAVDAAGSAFVVGNFTSSVKVGALNLLSAGGVDMFVAKLDGPAGNVTWGQRLGGITTDDMRGVAVDSAGSPILTGSVGGVVDFGGGQLPFGGGRDVFAVKLTAAGQHAWSKTYGGSGNESGDGVAADVTGNVILSGTYAANGVNFGGATFTGGDNYSTYLAKLDTNAAHLWSKGYDSIDLEFSAYVAVQANTNRIAYTFTNQGTVDFGNGPLASPGNNDSVVVGVFHP